MKHCIDCLLQGGDDVEILIIDDGSKDDTAKIADEYQDKYPTIIKAVHKPNGGHGSGVNKGLELATGLYYKVVDSDDWLDDDGYKHVISQIKKHLEANTMPDLYITDFLYYKPSVNKEFQRDFKSQFPVEKMFGWSEVHHFTTEEVFLMHALMYKTSALRESNLHLPEHTFYVDNIFAYNPLPYMKTMFYIPQKLYIYFIGRADQSVTVTNIVKRYKQQIVVMENMTDAFSYEKIKKMERGLKKYMFHALSVLMMVTLFFTCGENTKERIADTKELWAHIKKKDKKLYYKLRYRSYPVVVNFLPFGLKGKVMRYFYFKIANRQQLG